METYLQGISGTIKITNTIWEQNVLTASKHFLFKVSRSYIIISFICGHHMINN